MAECICTQGTGEMEKRSERHTERQGCSRDEIDGVHRTGCKDASTDSRSLLALRSGKCESLEEGKLLIVDKVKGSESAQLMTLSATGPPQITKHSIFLCPNALFAWSTAEYIAPGIFPFMHHFSFLFPNWIPGWDN